MKDWGFDIFLVRIARVRELRIEMQEKTHSFGDNAEDLEDVKGQPVLHAHTIVYPQAIDSV